MCRINMLYAGWTAVTGQTAVEGLQLRERDIGHAHATRLSLLLQAAQCGGGLADRCVAVRGVQVQQIESIRAKSLQTDLAFLPQAFGRCVQDTFSVWGPQ